MKNIDLLNLANAGILGIIANDLDASQAYKVLKFKRAVRKAFESLSEAEKDALKEAGIEDGAAFDKERKELSESGSNPARLEELDKQLARYNELRQALYKEDAGLADCKTMPYSDFHTLQKENAEMKYKPLNAFEDLLEGVLWAEEEDNQ